MRSVQLIDRFDLYQQRSLDENVDAEGSWKAKAVKFDVDRMLSRDRIAHSGEGGWEESLMDAFEQARPEFLVQPNGRIEHVAADPVDVRHTDSLRLCVSART
jgi:hypothetical protein